MDGRWGGKHLLGEATQLPLDRSMLFIASVLCAWGVTLHDDDVVLFGSDEAARETSTLAPDELACCPYRNCSKHHRYDTLARPDWHP